MPSLRHPRAVVRHLLARVRLLVERIAWEKRYRWTLRLLAPANWLLLVMRHSQVQPDSVLHISYMVHIPYYTTRFLRREGVKADYLAIGASPYWDRCDFQKIDLPGPFERAWQEFKLFWSVVARYEVVHLHFMIGLSHSGWELPLLKRLGRKLVIHYRGCEIRDREKNMTLHPAVNLCQKCDYNATICKSPLNERRRALSRRYGDAFLVTTPDLLDFAPQAEHVPFFPPEVEAAQPVRSHAQGRPFRIAHVTGHPGLEGTEEIAATIERLKKRGHRIEFLFLRDVPHREVLEALREVDLAIGKMKMGYYANAQIESMACGVPTITFVRDEFLTPELRSSGFIFSTLPGLEATLEHYLNHPEELEKKRAIARSSILRLHDPHKVARQLADVYDRVKAGTAR